MQIQSIKNNGITIALIESEQCLINDPQSALDLLINVKYETGCTSLAINKEAFTPDFFVLSTCLAGEILQKFINYGIRLAIYGDFSQYTSKPLKDFIYECNCGKNVYFQPNSQAAIDKLSSASLKRKKSYER